MSGRIAVPTRSPLHCSDFNSGFGTTPGRLCVATGDADPYPPDVCCFFAGVFLFAAAFFFEVFLANLRTLIQDATHSAANASVESQHLSREVRGHTRRLTQPDVVRSHIKGCDVAARVGGEEFAVLLPDTDLTGAGAVAVAEQIRLVVARGRLLDSQGQEVSQVTLSLGVAVSQPNEPLESLLQRADAVMYVAKRSGRNRVSVEAQTPGA